MSDLSTRYLGLPLKNPLIVSSSPLSESLENIKAVEDAGAAGLVMHSLFEEQIRKDGQELLTNLTQGTHSFAEALTYFPAENEFRVGPDEYLEDIYQAKKSVDMPIIGSLNGHSLGGWVEYAKKIEDAGADALELNIYFLATDPTQSGHDIETTYLDILKEVKKIVKIPVAVKLSPYFSSLGHMAKKLDDAGASGLVLFNRFYQPDIDLESLEITPNVMLSSPTEMRLPLRWIAILHGRLNASLAGSTGIFSATDVIKMMMVGADVTMMCSVILKHGISHIQHILNGINRWMTEREYESIEQMQGSMSQKACEDPNAFERAQYTRIITTQNYRRFASS